MVTRRRRAMPHQADMLRYLRDHGGGALFAEMRLGKCLPTIRHAQLWHDMLRALVLAPGSALGSWERELAAEGETDVAVLRGTRERRLETLAEPRRWTLANKECFLSVPEIGGRERCDACGGRGRVTIDDQRKNCRRCQGLGSVGVVPPPWTHVVLDESTFVRNPRAKVTRFCLESFGRAPVRVILSGTPNPESELEFWCQMAFVRGRARVFGCRSYYHFRAKHFAQGYDGWEPKPGVKRMMEKYLGVTAFRLRYRDALMPNEKVRRSRRLALPNDLREAYDTAESEFLLEYQGKSLGSTVYAGARWQWMRQMCGGFVAGECVWRGKLDELRGLLTGELARDQVVVWFCYNAELRAAEVLLTEAGVGCRLMCGDTSAEERRTMEEDFRAGRLRVLLLQVKIAEFGIDLSCADAAIYYSRNPALLTNVQSEDRIVHPKKTWPLLYVDLVVEDTVDEDVSDALGSKRWRMQRLLDAELSRRMGARRSA